MDRGAARLLLCTPWRRITKALRGGSGGNRQRWQWWRWQSASVAVVAVAVSSVAVTATKKTGRHEDPTDSNFSLFFTNAAVPPEQMTPRLTRAAAAVAVALRTGGATPPPHAAGSWLGSCHRLFSATTTTDDAMERVSKLLARRGECSRREAERLIDEGAVTVDGMVITTQVSPPTHHH